MSASTFDFRLADRLKIKHRESAEPTKSASRFPLPAASSTSTMCPGPLHVAVSGVTDGVEDIEKAREMLTQAKELMADDEMYAFINEREC